ncbi:DUF5343 domain-containing protein [Tsuneonella amylolytica]|uniref:DUF5343 domain-containing protein n=1 Tax=Tsuneonella amylolytica TaxID=2338327 RepID=UPI0018F88CB5|nr:DUF5343 domain-containing protein [Tsuneonella amylolytica]
MSDVVYTTVPGKIPMLLSKVKQTGVPPKVTHAWLKTIGFTSSNDGSLVGVLRVAGLVDSTGLPTERWSQFRGGRGKEALGEGIRQGYSELFAVYPDAHLRSSTELEHVFSSSSKAGKQAIQKAVSTFKNLVAEAEFSAGAADGETHFESQTLHAPVVTPRAAEKSGNNSGGPSLHIDVQVHISSEASADQIDQVFASMAKHLYGRD